MDGRGTVLMGVSFLRFVLPLTIALFLLLLPPRLAFLPLDRLPFSSLSFSISYYITFALLA